jgi:endonuclease YncB( thermonuclease family)
MIRQAFNKGPSRLLCCLAYATIAMSQPATGQATIAADCRLEPGPTRVVAHVIDGETVKLDDGSEARLIGALAPRASEVGAPRGSWPPEQAAIRALSDLLQGRSVTLSFGGRRMDRYAVALVHLTLERDGKEEWVQGAMLEQGMARAYAFPDNAACLATLIARERLAREAKRGLWANAAYQVRNADAPDDLVRLRHTFQLVTGTVIGTSGGRGQMYLNFGLRPDRTGFSVALRHAANVLPQGVQPKDLRGRVVLMRGWVGLSSGPLIEIDTPGQLELIDGPVERWSAQRTRQKEAPGERAAGRR